MAIDFRMRMRRTATTARRTLLAAIVVLAAGCARDVRLPPAVATSATAPAVAAVATHRAFIVAESMNDTWNTVGQVLVGLDGVGYETRAQMLGLYVLRYRGERLLVSTRALVMQDPHDGLRTRVVILNTDGSPNDSAAAADLLDKLERRVPLEAAKYRQPVRLEKRGKKR